MSDTVCQIDLDKKGTPCGQTAEIFLAYVRYDEAKYLCKTHFLQLCHHHLKTDREKKEHMKLLRPAIIEGFEKLRKQHADESREANKKNKHFAIQGKE